MNTPTVTFIHAYPLDVSRQQLFEAKNLGSYPPLQEVKEVMQHWEGIWKETNRDDRVIEKLIEVTHRIPERALECFVFGRGLNPMSTPFLIPIMSYGGGVRTDEDFLETMIHELLHIFVTANTKTYWAMVREKYSNESVLTQNHIIIFAMLAKVYKDLFGHMSPDFAREDLPEGYAQAMRVVKDKGYETVITEYNAAVQ